jgi:basic membrane lipoprotein Med (substrate-binding protein (PBP1-ABC) superfamily)
MATWELDAGRGAGMVGQMMRGRRNWWAAGTALAVALALLGWWFWPTSQPDGPRARQYKAQVVCLLTPPSGLADPASAQAWAGLEDVSARTRVQVRYVAVAGTDSPGTDTPFLASLAAQHCEGVVVSGSAETQAAQSQAHRFPQVQFFLIGRDAARGNLLGISYQSVSALRSAVADAVGHLVTE